MQALTGGLQVGAGIMMYVAIGAGEVGTGGLATPAAIGLGIWGTFSIGNGINTIAAAVHDQGPPEVLQITIAKNVYQSVTGSPMGPTGMSITKSAYYSIDILTCMYSIHADWSTLSNTGIIVRSYQSTTYTTRQTIQIEKVTSHLQLNWSVLRAGDAPLAGQTTYDFYSLGQDVYDWTSPEPSPGPKN